VLTEEFQRQSGLNVQDDKAEDIPSALEQPLEQLLPDEVGLRSDHWKWAIIGFVLPFVSIVPFHLERYRNRASQTGAVLGEELNVFVYLF
jgi:hypothetical protein